MSSINRSLFLCFAAIGLDFCNSKPQGRREETSFSKGIQALKPGTYVFAKGGLRLRAQPNEKSQIIELIPDLSRINIPGEEKHSVEFNFMHNDAQWVPASFQQKKGFVSREFLRTILSTVLHPKGVVEVLEVVHFPSQRGEYMLESEFYLRDPQKIVKLPGKFRETSQPFWIDERYLVFGTHFGDGGAGSDDKYRIDIEKNQIDFLHGSYYSISETGSCNDIPVCICGGRFYNYLNHVYYLEASKKQTLVYLLPKYPHEQNMQCHHGVPRNIMKKIAKIEEVDLTYNSEYYNGLQFTNGKKYFTIQADGKTIK